MIYVMLDHPSLDKTDLSSLELLLYGASAMSPSRLVEGIERIGPVFSQLYGQTEASLYVTCQADRDIRPDTVGPAAPHVDIRISDTGEVMFKSPGMFLGYFKESEKTAEAMTADGYVKTGDAGFFDEDGHLKIIDRAKDVGRLNDGTRDRWWQ